MKNRKLRTYLWLTLCLSLLLFTACVNNDDTGSSSDNLHSSSQNQGNNNFSMAGESPIANDGDIVVFANFDNFKTTSTGNSNRTESYQQITGIYGIITEDMATNKLLAKDYFDSNSTNFENLTDEVIIKYSGDKVIPVTNKVTYIDYTIDDRYTPKQEWIDYFKEELYEKSIKSGTPIIIKEAWFFNWNGVECVAVNASNVSANFHNVILSTPDSIDMELPHNNYIIYTQSAIFLPTGEIYNTYFNADDISYTISGDNDTYSFSIPIDSNDYQSYAYSIQKNRIGDLVSIPIFTNVSNSAFLLNFTINTEYMLIDFLPNKKAELVCDLSLVFIPGSFTNALYLSDDGLCKSRNIFDSYFDMLYEHIQYP